MEKTMSQPTRTEVLKKLRRRYESAGPEHKRKLLDQAQELLGYHRKAAIRALRAPEAVRASRIITGRPVMYEPERLLRWLRPIWAGTDYACGRRLVAMLPEWIPAYEQDQGRLPGVGAVAGPGSGPFSDAAWDLAAPANSHSRERLGGRQGWLAGGGHGRLVRRQRGRSVCVDGGRSGLRDDLGGVAGDVGTGPGRDAVGMSR